MKTLLEIFVLVLLGAIAQHGLAQVYESKDSEGRPVFSDSAAEGAAPVDVQPTNQADSVKMQPPRARSPEKAGNTAAPERGTVEYQQKLDREMEAYEREQERLERERHSEKRHEVGDEGLQRHEVGDDAEMRRHEVGSDDDE